MGCALSAPAFAGAANEPPAAVPPPESVSGLRVSDFVEVEGAQANYLHGFGIMAGLNGSGDSPRSATSTILQRYLGRLENEAVGDLQSRSVALVSVTAELPPFQRPGTRIDVRVSALGDARSLEGGTLLMTPLRSPGARTQDDLIYALAQGPISVDGQGRAGNTTTGTVVGGAIVRSSVLGPDREPADEDFFLADEPWTVTFRAMGEDGRPQDRDVALSLRTFRLLLKRPGFARARAVAEAVNTFFNAQTWVPASLRDHFLRSRVAEAVDEGTVRVRIPDSSELVVEEPGTGRWVPGVDRQSVAPFSFVATMLASPFTAVSDPRLVEAPRVVLNQGTGAITISGNVVVHEGFLRGGLQGTGLRLIEGRSLASLLYDANVQRAFTPRDLIEMIRQAHAAGLIEAELVTQ